MIITGAITGMACKRHLSLFRSMIDSESQASAASAKTVQQTRIMAQTIQKSTNEIFLSSKDIFTTANNQAASVQEIESTRNENTQIAADISEKTGSVASIAIKTEEDVTSGFSVLERNVVQMEDIKTKNDSVITGIVSLGNKINKIRDIIKTINTITDQTKVIAFNAALEAASAGDKGKRFSVVASEVNRLADDIAVLTRQIKEQVEEIQDSSSSLIISSEESADKITEGRKLIKDLEEIFREIKNGAEITANQAQTITVSTQKQQKSTEQINIAIVDISQGLNNFIHSTEVATSSAEGLTRMIDELEKLLDARIAVDTGGGPAPDAVKTPTVL
jgi:methyl-accepting chemotaxis protein